MSPHERGRGMVKNFARRLGWTALAGTVLTGGGGSSSLYSRYIKSANCSGC